MASAMEILQIKRIVHDLIDVSSFILLRTAFVLKNEDGCIEQQYRVCSLAYAGNLKLEKDVA